MLQQLFLPPMTALSLMGTNASPVILFSRRIQNQLLVLTVLSIIIDLASETTGNHAPLMQVLGQSPKILLIYPTPHSQLKFLEIAVNS